VLLESGPLCAPEIHFDVTQRGARVTAARPRGVVRIELVLRRFKRHT
jgi:hypothetical protein